MSRCQHCNKLTHSEDLYVTYKAEDAEKVCELMSLKDWTCKYTYRGIALAQSSPNEFGKLKCGDIYIHFVVEDEKKE